MRLAIISMLALSFMKGCDISGGPEVISGRFQAALRPYFPNARAKAVPDQGVIIGLTCVQGAGPKLVAEAADYVIHNKDVSRLRTLRKWGPLLGSPSYHHVQLGFDRAILALNVDTWKIEYPPLTDTYISSYRRDCGLQDPQAEPAEAAEAGPYLWVGHFTAKLGKAVNGKATLPLIQSLGIYSSDGEFESHRTAELNARLPLIRSQLAEQKVDATEISLDWVEKLRLPGDVAQ
ncbi:MAG TPA: hypothetical protein VFI72_04020 [Candidatus Angelobacter sp.]|nr:hypothetical protein [Candidatus Angelobacter sp.]